MNEHNAVHSLRVSALTHFTYEEAICICLSIEGAVWEKVQQNREMVENIWLKQQLHFGTNNILSCKINC